jgi:NADH-quinone oxidoreductase subunit I
MENNAALIPPKHTCNRSFSIAMLSIIKTLWRVFLHLFQKKPTIQYPDQKRRLPPRTRGRIVLTKDPDGKERCVACYLCSAVCPVGCISLQAKDNPDGRRSPACFRINFSRCIFCGLCEEACPTRAIQLTPDVELSEYCRKDLVYEKEDLEISGTGKYPDYNFYRVCEKDPPADIKSLMP